MMPKCLQISYFELGFLILGFRTLAGIFGFVGYKKVLNGKPEHI
jgi:hypothetical protein